MWLTCRRSVGYNPDGPECWGQPCQKVQRFVFNFLSPTVFRKPLRIRELLSASAFSGKQNAYTDTIMPELSNINSVDFLASTTDLISVFAHLANSSRGRSRQHRRDREFIQTALSSLRGEFATTNQLAPMAVAAPAAAGVSPPRRTLVGVKAKKGRKYCRCGQCTWCLENARWDRIFNEKYADPTYYSGLMLKHSSTLAAAR